MENFFRQMYLIAALILPIRAVIYESTISLSSMGQVFRPKINTTTLLLVSARNYSKCAALCNAYSSCRTFNYDSSTQQCQLFEADVSIGSIVSSSSSSSIVGTVKIIPSLYLSLKNQSCAMCLHSRYQFCSNQTNTCQCPSNTYWNGQVCALKLFQNDTCTQIDSCRTDLNLTCSVNCYGEFGRCIQMTSFLNSNLTNSVRNGITVAGNCNKSSTSNLSVLYWPADVLLLPNDTLYVANYDRRLIAFQPNNRIGQTIATFNNWPTFMYFDNKTSEFYVSVVDLHLVFLLSSNRTIPPDGLSTGVCSTSRLNRPQVIVTDSLGNVFISSNQCNWVMKWAPNATNGTIVAGLGSGSSGNTPQALNVPYGLALDENNSFLYVVDSANHRVQRFSLNGSSNAVTVAGGNGGGAAANQLNGPSEILLSRLDGSLYVADRHNNRVQKWLINASLGVTVAGSATGLSGNTSDLMDGAYAIALNNDETFLYVSDTNNYRIQRFSLR